MKNNLRQKIKGIIDNSNNTKDVNLPEKWKHEAQIVEYLILPEMAKLSKDKVLKGVKVFVELDSIFLDIKMEDVEGYIYHERYSHPDDMVSDFKALKSYFEESGYITKESEYGFYVILKP